MAATAIALRQGVAARDWLAAREADLLPVGYFHLVFTLPAEIALIALSRTRPWSTTCCSRRAAARDADHHCRRSSAFSAPASASPPCSTAGVQAMTHHPHLHLIVPERRNIARRETLGAVPTRLLLASARVLSRLFRRLFLAGLADAHAAGRLAFCGELDSLHVTDGPSPPISRRSAGRTGSSTPSRPFAGPEAVCWPISRAKHPPRRHLEQPPARPRRARRELPLQGLHQCRNGQARYRTMTARARRVHQALPTPRPAQGVPPHPSLRAIRQRQLQDQYRARQRTDRHARAGMTDPPVERDDAGPGRQRRRRRPSPGMPLLRWPRMIIVETFERGRRTTRPAIVQCRGQDRDAMTPSPPSSHHAPAGEAHFRHPITVVPTPAKTRATSPIIPKSPASTATAATKIPTPIVDPTTITSTTAAPTQAVAPANTHRRRQAAHPNPAGSFPERLFRTPAPQHRRIDH